jgi:hypothetical protein
LARAEALPEKGRARTALVVLIAVPLLLSIIGSTIGSGPVGVVASLGSAAFSAMAYLVATTSAAAISALVARIDGRARITATEVPTGNEGREELPRRSDRDRDALEVVGEEIAEQASDYLRSHGSPSERSHDNDRSHGTESERSHGDTFDPDDRSGTESGEVTASERPSEHERSHGDDRPLTAQERRRLEGVKNRRRVADFLYQRPNAHTAEIATELGLGESTVRRIRKEIDGEAAS